ncbi:MAG: HlyD family type I secretion periplasmic adaptor subunit, partial [Alphaproteobacteria bacterium]
MISEFQPDAIEIEERSPPATTRLTLYAVAVLIVAAVVWASLSKVDEIVTAQGKLTTTEPNLVVQPLETSVIRELHVAVGDVVHRDQPLATLDPTFPKADVDALRTRIAALDAAIARLEAELDGGDFVPPDPTNPDGAVQSKLFQQRRGYFKASLNNYDAQIASLEAQLQTNKSEEALTAQRFETLRSIEAMRSELMEAKTGSKLNLLLSRASRLEIEDNLAHMRGDQLDLTHKLEKTRSERQVFIQDFGRTALQDLVDTLAKRNAAAEDLKKAELRQHMVVLTTPVEAIVLEIAHRSIGSVAREAETLFSLVPRDAPLQAEISVDNKDIGELTVGQHVRLKFDAFPFQKYGTATGVVRVISQDSFVPQGGGEEAGRAPLEQAHRPSHLFYRVLVDLTDTRLRGQPEQSRIIPGMTVTAEM